MGVIKLPVPLVARRLIVQATHHCRVSVHVHACVMVHGVTNAQLSTMFFILLLLLTVQLPHTQDGVLTLELGTY